MTKISLRSLVICSDARAEELAEVLSVVGSSAKLAVINNEWQLHELTSTGWRSGDTTKLQAPYDCTFVHAGAGDPEGIRRVKLPGLTFVFSGGGMVSSTLPENLAHALPIFRPFHKGRCPIGPDEVAELREFVAQPSRVRPAFCEPTRTRAALMSLAILVQTYALATAILGDAGERTVLRPVIGDVVNDESIMRRYRERLIRLWPQLQLADHYRWSLGLQKDSDNLRFLAELCEDCGVDTRSIVGAQGVGDHESRMNALRADKVCEPIAAFLSGKPSAESSAKAYAAIVLLLARG